MLKTAAVASNGTLYEFQGLIAQLDTFLASLETDLEGVTTFLNKGYLPLFNLKINEHPDLQGISSLRKELGKIRKKNLTAAEFLTKLNQILEPLGLLAEKKMELPDKVEFSFVVDKDSANLTTPLSTTLGIPGLGLGLKTSGSLKFNLDFELLDETANTVELVFRLENQGGSSEPYLQENADQIKVDLNAN